MAAGKDPAGTAVPRASDPGRKPRLASPLPRPPSLALPPRPVIELEGPGEDFAVLAATGRATQLSPRSLPRFPPAGNPASIALCLGKREVKVFATAPGPVCDFLVLEVLLRHRHRYRTIFALDRFNRYRSAFPRARPPAAGPWPRLGSPLARGTRRRLKGSAQTTLLHRLKRGGKGHQEDLQVQTKRPVGDVEVVQFDPLPKGGLAA